MATGLSSSNTPCTRFERNLSMLMDNNKNHQITPPKGRIGFLSLGVVILDEPKYQIWNPYELMNANISTDARYNDCFLFLSTLPAQSSDVILQIIYGAKDSILQQPNSIGDCVLADARKSKSFADFFPKESWVLWDHSTSSGIQPGSVMTAIWWVRRGFAINPTYRLCLKH